MKRHTLKIQILSAVLAVLIAVCALPMMASEADSVYKTGDMNRDGVVNSDDAIYLLRHTLDPEKYPIECNHNYEDGFCTVCGEAEPKNENAVEKLLESKHTLKFDEKGNFKILVFADLHLKASSHPESVENGIKILVDREKPDLIILTGDNIQDRNITTDAVFKETIYKAMDYVESKQIPWMHVYGNHDSEGSYTREQQQKVYEEFEYCISKTGDDITGVGNYVIPVYASEGDQVKFTVWGLDSGDYMSEEDKAALCPVESPFGGYTGTNYDYIHGDQIEWYVESSKLLAEYNGGAAIPGLMAFHIPLQESYSAWINREGLEWTGEKREPICASAYNSGLFNALVTRGDIKAVVNGHDHINDFMVEYGGIKLCYSPCFSTNIYNSEEMHGGRVFVVNEDNPSDIETYVSYVTERHDFSNVEELGSDYVYDFEGEAPDFTLTGLRNDTSEDFYVDEIVADVVEGMGVNGSKALATKRTAYHDLYKSQNTEVKWDIEEPGLLGNNKYFKVWIDLETNNLEFRKACFGLITNYSPTLVYKTDSYDVPFEFYYMPEGSNRWQTLTSGDDGCIGASDECPVGGFKGWFAFPIEYMVADEPLNSDSVITGIYFYYSFPNAENTNKYVYIDDISLVEELDFESDCQCNFDDLSQRTVSVENGILTVVDVCSECGEKSYAMTSGTLYDSTLNTANNALKVKDGSVTLSSSMRLYSTEDVLGADADPFWIAFDFTLNDFNVEKINRNINGSNVFNFSGNGYSPLRAFLVKANGTDTIEKSEDNFKDDLSLTKIAIKSNSAGKGELLLYIDKNSTHNIALYCNPADKSAEIYIDGKYKLTRADAMGTADDGQWYIRFQDSSWGNFKLDNFVFAKIETPGDPEFDSDGEDALIPEKMIYEYDFTKQVSDVNGFTLSTESFEYADGQGYKSKGNNGILRIADNNISLKGKSVMLEADIIFDELPYKTDSVTNFPLSVITWIRKTQNNTFYDWAVKIDDQGRLYVKDGNTPTDVKIEQKKKYTLGALYDENDSQIQVYLDGAFVGAKSFSSGELVSSSVRLFDAGEDKACFSATVCGARAYHQSIEDMLQDATASVFDYKDKNPDSTLYFMGFSDKDALSYKVNEEVNFEIYLMADNEVVSAPYFYYSVSGEDGQDKTEGYADGSKGHFSVKGMMTKPGALRVEAYVCDENKVKLTSKNSSLYIENSTSQKSDLRFKGGAIVGFDEVIAGGNIPTDLGEYWSGVVSDCYDGDINLLRFDELDPADYGGTNKHKLYLVEIECEGGFATGYLTVPNNKDSLLLRCNFVSYGATKKPTPTFSDDYVNFSICAHSYHLDDPNASVDSNYGFNSTENQNRDTVYFKSMFIRNITAARFLKAYIGDESYGKIIFENTTITPLNKWNTGDEFYIQGGSQAAFQSIALTALDKDVTSASLGVPWFCDIGGDLVGRFSGWNPTYTDALMYYDSCALATLVENDVSITITAGLGDTTSEPSGVVALYNALNCEKTISMYQNRDHSYNPPVKKIYTVSNKQ